MINASLYSLESFERLESPCHCNVTDETRWPEIKCYWQDYDIYKYISLALSTFSISHTLMMNGYMEIFPSSLTGNKKLLIQGLIIKI